MQKGEVKYTFLLIQAEVLHNRYMNYINNLDYSEESEELIRRVANVYDRTIGELQTAGIGGILLNGVFHSTEKEFSNNIIPSQSPSILDLTNEEC